MITDSTRALFAKEVAKYPYEMRQSAVMACLAIVQQEQGYVSRESEQEIADYLGMAPIAVHEVTTFYNMYNQKPVGKYKLNVCTNLPCQLRDGAVALHYLEMPPIAVHEVTTFYNMYNTEPVGRWKLNVCTNLPCQLRDGQTALAHICHKLDVEVGGTTADGQFTVQQSECLGACADAPVMLVNDREMISFMSNDRIDDLLATLSQAK